MDDQAGCNRTTRDDVTVGPDRTPRELDEDVGQRTSEDEVIKTWHPRGE